MHRGTSVAAELRMSTTSVGVVVAASMFLIAACAASIPESLEIGPGLGSTHAGTTSSIMPLAPVAPPTSRRLLAATNELVRTGPEGEHRQLVHAMQVLADALEVLTPRSADAIL